MSTYAVAREEEVLGMFSNSQISSMLQEGEILESDLVYTEGFDGWKTIAEVAELQIEYPHSFQSSEIENGGTHASESITVKGDFISAQIDNSAFTVGRDGQILGEFSAVGIKLNLDEGKLLYSDLIFQEGYDEWKTIAEVPSFRANDPTPTPEMELSPAEVYVTRPVTDSGEIISIKRFISKWSNGQKFHPYQNLGDKIFETCAIEYPIFVCRILTLYEKRVANYGHSEPFISQPIPTKTIDLADVQIWSYDFPIMTEFSDKDTIHELEETREVFDCDTCQTIGTISCPECNEEGHVECPGCEGVGNIECSNCDGGVAKCVRCTGAGKKIWNSLAHGNLADFGGGRCVTCGGDGKIRNSGRMCHKCNGTGMCFYCNGSGTETCKECRGRGDQRCNQCNAKGIIICETCTGNGIVECPACEGHQQLTRCCQITQEEFAIREARVYGDEKSKPFNDDGDEIIKQNGDEVFVKDQNSQFEPFQLGEGEAFSGLNSYLLEMLHSSSNCNRGQLGQDLRINKQHFVITKISHVKVVYKFSKSEGSSSQYEMWLSLRDGTICAEVSPISEYSEMGMGAFKSFLKVITNPFNETNWIQLIGFGWDGSSETISKKSWRATKWFLYIAGIFGTHMIYLDRPGAGLAKMFTLNYFFIGMVIDIKALHNNAMTDGDGNYVINQTEASRQHVHSAATPDSPPPPRN